MEGVGIRPVKKISDQQISKVLLRKTYEGPGLTWSNVWKTVSE